MRLLQKLFDQNRVWANSVKESDPKFFERLAKQQSPEYLWIGCSDSRVPANQIVGLLPGDIFVHRNIANVVVHTDLNCLSVIQFAVDALKVRHIIVCGHYGCSGVGAALSGERIGLADNWLRHVQDVAELHKKQLTSQNIGSERHDRLCELNVIEQVANVCRTSIVQDAWARGQKIAVHGWIYRIKDGLIRDLSICVSSQAELAKQYETALNPLICHPE